MSDVVVRELRGLAEMDALRRTAGIVWGGTAADMVSSDFLMALAHAGGYIAGAFRDDEMVGCSFGILVHQRDWALHKGLAAITWTFDPLVRRNGWFNLRRLGARAVEYHVDFYGALNDDINGSGETDRLLAWWDVDPSRSTNNEPATPLIEVPTPVDIVTLRRTDPVAAHEWRHSMRDRLAPLLDTHDVVGMNDNGDYILTRKETR